MKHLKEYINESILSSTGSGFAGKSEELKNWFLNGCSELYNAAAYIHEIDIQLVENHYDIIIPKTTKFFKSVKRHKAYLTISNKWKDLEKYLPMINCIRFDNGIVPNIQFEDVHIKTTKILPVRCGKKINFVNSSIDVFNSVPQGVFTVIFDEYLEGNPNHVGSFENIFVPTINADLCDGKWTLDCKLENFKNCGTERVGNLNSCFGQTGGLYIHETMFNTKNVFDKEDPFFLTQEATDELDELFSNNPLRNGKGIDNADKIRIYNSKKHKFVKIDFNKEKRVYKMREDNFNFDSSILNK